MNRRPTLLLLLYLSAILYLSLYPWRIVPNSGAAGLYWIPFFSRRVIFDGILNLMFYVPVGAAAFLSFRRRRTGVFIGAFIGASGLGTLVSFFVESIQLYIPTRSGNLTDLLSNSVGSVLGASLALAASSTRAGSRLRVLYSPRLFVLGLWVLWMAFTFLPRYGPPIDVSHQMVGLLILALVAAGRRLGVSTILLLLWLALDELRPFQFRGPYQPFSWLPFESWFTGALESYYGTFFGKLFFYTAIVWVERKAGLQWIWALLLPGAILFAGELAQCYLPGRTPELTDVVLLLGGGLILYLAEPAHWDNKGQS